MNRADSAINHERAEADPRAAFFDERADTWEDRCYPAETKQRLALLVPLLQVLAGTAVLDLGTGTGILTPYLRELLGPDGTLISLDISFAMLRRAKAKQACARGCVAQATAMRLPIQDRTVDTAICFAAFPHFSDKPGALAEMNRVLKVGGSLSIAHLLSREELSRHHGGHSAVAQDKLPDDAAMQRLIQAAGFAALRITDIPGRYIATAVKE